MLHAALAIATAALFSWPFQSVKQTDEAQYQITAPGTLSVETASGNIRVQTWAGSSVKVVVHKRAQTNEVLAALRVELNATNGDVTLKAIYPHACSNCDISFDIAVPRSVSVAATTASGAIRIADVGGSLSLDAASGDVAVQNAGGSVAVRTSSGDIRVDGAAGSVRCTSASGDIRVGGVRGDLDARTASGDVSARFGDLAAVHSIALEAASGDIALALPRGAGATINAKAAIGSIANDFGVAPRHGYVGATLLQTIGDGRVKVQVKVASGDVVLRAIEKGVTE